MFGIKKRIKKRIDTRIAEYCYHELKGIKMERKKGVYNYRCFSNACDYAVSNKGYEVVMGIYKEKGEDSSSLHFWARKGIKDYEVSVGYLCDRFKYFEIKIVDKDDYLDIQEIFDEALDYYFEKLTTPFERFMLKIFKIKRIL